jgi:ABC-type branched-subunit amino acid transport system substrate-binding protein
MIVAALAGASCSAVLTFHECNVDTDCVGMTSAGTPLYCSDDHMCVGAIPDYLLCHVDVPADGNIPSGALVIGGLYRTSGANDVNDHAFRNAANLAAGEFLGLGYNIAHVVCDTAGDANQAGRAYRVVIERFGAHVVVGPDTSDEVINGVAPMIKRYGVPIISPSATNPNITLLDDDHLIWRTAASDNLQGKVLGQLPPATAKLDVIFVNNSNYAKGLKDAFVASFPGMVNIIGFTGGNTTEMMAAVATAAGDMPTYALLIADFDAPPLVVAVSTPVGLSMTQFLMTDSAKKPSLWGQLSNYAVLSRIRGTGPANPAFSDPSGMAFQVMQTNYKSRFGEDPAETAFVANTYDAFYVAAMGGLAAPNHGGRAIVEMFGKMSGGTKVPVGPNSLTAITTLQMGGNIDLVGTSGPIDFTQDGDIVSAPIEVWSINNTATPPTFHQDAIITP